MIALLAKPPGLPTLSGDLLEVLKPRPLPTVADQIWHLHNVITGSDSRTEEVKTAKRALLRAIAKPMDFTLHAKQPSQAQPFSERVFNQRRAAQ
jgi:hypothetical protein